jgi:hypothetical protein
MEVEIARRARWHRLDRDRLYNLSMTGEKAMAFPGAQANRRMGVQSIHTRAAPRLKYGGIAGSGEMWMKMPATPKMAAEGQ